MIPACQLDCHNLSPDGQDWMDAIQANEDLCVACLINNSLDHFIDRWESELLKDSVFNKNVSDMLRRAFQLMIEDGSDILTLIKEKHPAKVSKVLTILKI
jgi:hypothetical protein